MIERIPHGDVEQLRLTWWRSRLIDFAVNVFIVRDVMVDTGFPAVAHDVVRIALERRVRGALVTHQHEDHAGNVEPLAAARVPLGMSAPTREIVAHPAPIGFYRRFTWRSMPALQLRHETFADDTLELVPTPGHSEDHHVVWDHRTDTLFAGDLFLGVKVRVAHRDERPTALIASLRAMAERRPLRVFCAHRGLVPGGASALTAKADWMEDAISQMRRLDGAGTNPRDIRRRVLGRRGLAHWFSMGDYSSDNFVRAALRER